MIPFQNINNPVNYFQDIVLVSGDNDNLFSELPFLNLDTSAGSANLTGINNTTAEQVRDIETTYAGIFYQFIIRNNHDTNTLTLKHLSADSEPENRFYINDLLDRVLQPGEFINGIYVRNSDISIDWKYVIN